MREERSQGRSLHLQLRNNVVSVSSALPSLTLVNSSELNAKATSSAAPAPAQLAASSSLAPTTASAAATAVAAQQQQTLVRVKVPTTRVLEQDLLLSHSYPHVAVAATQVSPATQVAYSHSQMPIHALSCSSSSTTYWSPASSCSCAHCLYENVVWSCVPVTMWPVAWPSERSCAPLWNCSKKFQLLCCFTLYQSLVCHA